MYLKVNKKSDKHADRIRTEKKLSLNFPSLIQDSGKYKLVKRYQNDNQIAVSGYSSGVLDSDINQFITDFRISGSNDSFKYTCNVEGALNTITDILLLITKTGTQYRQTHKLLAILGVLLNLLEDVDAIEENDLMAMAIKRLKTIVFLDKEDDAKLYDMINKYEKSGYGTIAPDRRKLDLSPDYDRTSKDMQISEAMDFARFSE